jgi:hypothetical protein
MTRFEYAYILWDDRSGVVTWLPSSSSGDSGRAERVPRKVDEDTIMRQQIALLCEQGWEIFQVSPIGYTEYSHARPSKNVYHFRRWIDEE